MLILARKRDVLGHNAHNHLVQLSDDSLSRGLVSCITPMFGAGTCMHDLPPRGAQRTTIPDFTNGFNRVRQADIRGTSLIQVTNAKSTDLAFTSGEFTIAMWVWVNFLFGSGVGLNHHRVLSRSNFVDNDTNAGWSFLSDEDLNCFTFESYQNDDIGLGASLNTTTAPAAGKAFCLVHTSDGSAVRELWCNGVMEATNGSHINPIDTATGLYVVGDASAGYVLVLMACAWNRVLTKGEIRKFSNRYRAMDMFRDYKPTYERIVYPTQILPRTVSVSDSVSVAESVALAPPFFPLSVSDALTLTESVTVRTTLNINVNQSVFVVDVPDASTRSVVGTEDITVGESVSMNMNISVSCFDAVAVTDVQTVIKVFSRAVGESVLVTDVPQVMIPITINLSDSIAVEENSTVQNPTLPITITQVVSVGSVVTVGRATQAPVVNQSITVSDVATIAVQLVPSVNQSITLTESLMVVASGPVASVFDVLAVSESITVSMVRAASPNDSVVLSESVAVALGTASPVITQTVTVSESVTVRITNLVSVTDAVTLGEYVSVGYYTRSVSEVVALSEQVIVVIGASPPVVQTGGLDYSYDEALFIMDEEGTP